MKLRYLALFPLLYTQWVFAFVQYSGLDDIELGSWSGTGGLQGSDTFCLQSKRSATSGVRVRYDVAAYGPDDGAGNFVLVNTVDSSQLPIQFTWVGNSGTYLMTDYNVTGYTTPQQQGATNCAQADANLTIEIEVLAAALASASAGTYTGSFSVDALQRQNPFRYTIDNFTITVPELVQITDLDDIDLGTFDGVNDAVGSDQLCIFRNGGADYSLRASGGVGVTDPFLLSNGGTTVGYSVAFREGAGAFVQRTPGQKLGSLTGSPVQDCGGGTNAEVQVSVSSIDLGAVSPGTYTGILYIVAEPE